MNGIRKKKKKNVPGTTRATTAAVQQFIGTPGISFFVLHYFFIYYFFSHPIHYLRTSSLSYLQ